MEKIQLETDENILVQIRKHWFILFSQLFLLTIAALIPFGGYVMFSSAETTGTLEALASIHTGTLMCFYIIWLLVIWMAAFNIWTDYYLDVWTLTNKRLIAVDQRGLFHRTVGTFRLERLQDMNVEVNGILATFLNYGIIEAQTAAGEDDEFRAHGIPNPREFKAEILKAADARIAHYETSPHSEDGV